MPPIHESMGLRIYIGTSPDGDDPWLELERYIVIRAVGVFIKERLDIIKIESVVAAITNTIRFQRATLAPESDRIGMNVQQVGNLGYGQHPPG
jgi:hypothetical protein